MIAAAAPPSETPRIGIAARAHIPATPNTVRNVQASAVEAADTLVTHQRLLGHSFNRECLARLLVRGSSHHRRLACTTRAATQPSPPAVLPNMGPSPPNNTYLAQSPHPCRTRHARCERQHGWSPRGCYPQSPGHAGACFQRAQPLGRDHAPVPTQACPPLPTPCPRSTPCDVTAADHGQHEKTSHWTARTRRRIPREATGGCCPATRRCSGACASAPHPHGVQQPRPGHWQYCCQSRPADDHRLRGSRRRERLHAQRGCRVARHHCWRGEAKSETPAFRHLAPFRAEVEHEVDRSAPHARTRRCPWRRGECCAGTSSDMWIQWSHTGPTSPSHPVTAPHPQSAFGSGQSNVAKITPRHWQAEVHLLLAHPVHTQNTSLCADATISVEGCRYHPG